MANKCKFATISNSKFQIFNYFKVVNKFNKNKLHSFICGVLSEAKFRS